MSMSWLLLLSLGLHTANSLHAAHDLGTSRDLDLQRDLAHVTCEEAQRQCERQPACLEQLGLLRQRCPDLTTCPDEAQISCYGALATLQKGSVFSGCECDLRPGSDPSCMRTHQFIYSHACLEHGAKFRHGRLGVIPKVYGGRQGHAEAEYGGRDNKKQATDSSHNGIQESHSADIPLRDAWQSVVDDDYNEGSLDYPDFTGEEEDDEEEDGWRFNSGSCIFERKICLQNTTCNHWLTNFRMTCRENKKKSECVSLHIAGCYESITTLQSLSPVLFYCTCEQRKESSRQKCRHIQSRIANNTCLVDVPYIIHTHRAYERSYDDVLRMTKAHVMSANTPLLTDRVDCSQALLACESDIDCRKYMRTYLDACLWLDESFTCNRPACLAAVKEFFLYVRPARTHDLLFCGCSEEDPICNTARDVLYPNCVRVGTPPPTCLDLKQRCMENKDCRVRYENYDLYCGFQGDQTLCPDTPAMCRSAIKGLMGTPLLTNCTCPPMEESRRNACEDVRWRLQGYSPCKRDAVDHYALVRREEVQSQEQPVSHDISPDRRDDCSRSLKKLFPNYMSIPEIIRRYNGSDGTCSEVCSCVASNGSLSCVKLSCAPNSACAFDNIVYSHGSTFMHQGRGQCRCIRGEMVCARPTSTSLSSQRQPGLYLYVGYSVTDLYQLESQSGLRFSVQSVTAKLATLLNGDSAEQFCELRPLNEEQHRSNLIFRIDLSTYNTKKDGMEGCQLAAKSLGNMVNSRLSAIIADAELSVVKVAQLEQVNILNSVHLQPSYTHSDDVIHADYDIMALEPYTSTGSRTFGAKVYCTYKKSFFVILLVHYLYS